MQVAVIDLACGLCFGARRHIGISAEGAVCLFRDCRHFMTGSQLHCRILIIYEAIFVDADRQLIALAQHLRVGIIALQEHTDGEIACLRIQAMIITQRILVVDRQHIDPIACKCCFLYILCIDQVALFTDLRDHIVFIRDQRQFFAYRRAVDGGDILDRQGDFFILGKRR